MRALLNGERNGTVGVVAGLFALVCLLIASVGLNLRHINDLDRLQNLIYQRCITLSVPQNDARRVEIMEWSRLAARESDPEAAESYQRLADAMQAAVDASESNPCRVYKRAAP